MARLAESHNFEVVFGPDASILPIGFKEIDGLSDEIERLEYWEGNSPTRPVYVPKRRNIGSVTFKRGVDQQRYLYRWYAAVVSAMGGVKPSNFPFPLVQHISISHYFTDTIGIERYGSAVGALKGRGTLWQGDMVFEFIRHGLCYPSIIGESVITG